MLLSIKQDLGRICIMTVKFLELCLWVVIGGQGSSKQGSVRRDECLENQKANSDRIKLTGAVPTPPGAADGVGV